MLTPTHESQGGISQITKTKKKPFLVPPGLSPATHSPCFSSLPTNWSRQISLASPVGAGDTPTMFSSIPFLFVYPYMPFFVLLFSSYMVCECCVCVRHLFCFISSFRILPRTSSMLQRQASLAKVRPNLSMPDMLLALRENGKWNTTFADALSGARRSLRGSQPA